MIRESVEKPGLGKRVGLIAGAMIGAVQMPYLQARCHYSRQLRLDSFSSPSPEVAKEEIGKMYHALGYMFKAGATGSPTYLEKMDQTCAGCRVP
jgi:hypothetical protein